MGIKVSIDGSLLDESDAKVSVFDRGFLYGDSVFEVMRTYEGVPFAERPHLERLFRSCERTLIVPPVSMEVLSTEIAATLTAAGNEESYVRVVITRGTGPLTYDLTTARNPTRVVVVAPLPPQPAAARSEGIGLLLVRASRPTDDSRAAGAKASNYLANMLALHEARGKGASEAILLGPSGEVLEGASSNVFCVYGEHLKTPRPEAGILEGITRATVLSVARAQGITVEETALFPRDVYDADEVFITSTLREVLPAVTVDGRTIGTGRPGPVTKRLHQAFLDAVRKG